MTNRDTRMIRDMITLYDLGYTMMDIGVIFCMSQVGVYYCLRDADIVTRPCHARGSAAYQKARRKNALWIRDHYQRKLNEGK